MTASEFLAIYPDFIQSSTMQKIEFNIRLANMIIDQISSFGDIREDALTLLIAHLLSLGIRAGSQGNSVIAKTSKKVGDVQFSYAQSSKDRAWYDLTSYGQQLLMLIDLQPKYGGAFVV